MTKAEKTIAFWTAVGAVGGLMAGGAAFIPVLAPSLRSMWESLPPIGSLDVWHVVAAVGLVIATVGSIIAVRLARRLKRLEASDPSVLTAPGERRNDRALVISLTVQVITATAFAVFVFTGGIRSVKDTVEAAAGREPPKPLSDSRANSLEKVCADARQKFRTRAGRDGPFRPTGSWTGWATWYSTEQQWTFAKDGSVRLTKGRPGLWRMEGDMIVITFQQQTVFRARRYGELLCGVRVQPGAAQPDGNFQMVYVAPPEADESDSAESVNQARAPSR
jgi:hypothetical protein